MLFSVNNFYAKYYTQNFFVAGENLTGLDFEKNPTRIAVGLLTILIVVLRGFSSKYPVVTNNRNPVF
jgi:hypothetical protein